MIQFSVSLVVFLVYLTAGQTAISQDESLDPGQLYQEGNAAFAQGDYVAAEYYFQRLAESPGWAEFDQRVDVLGKLGMVEEGQSRFAPAAEWYRLVLNELEARRQGVLDAFYQYYAVRYAECLQRAGDYDRAAEVLWRQFELVEPVVKTTILERILSNARFRELSDDDLITLREAVEANGFQSLGWDLADLYRRNQLFDRAVSTYEALWRDSPSQAREHLDAIIECYQAQNRLPELIEEISKAVDSGANPNQFILLENELLRALDRTEEALDRIEAALSALSGDGRINAASLAGRAPATLTRAWLETMEPARGEETVLESLREWVRLQPDDIIMRDELAQRLANQGKGGEAASLWLEWAESRNNDPGSLLHAAERLAHIGQNEAAAELLSKNEAMSDPQYAIRSGQLALRVGDFPLALKRFESAASQSPATGAIIQNAVIEYAETAIDAGALVDALIENATGRAYSDIPAWRRTSLEKIAFQQHRQNDLYDLAQAEPSGAWRLQIAQTAAQRGENEFALRLLRSIDPESPYIQSAEREKALLLGNAFSLPEKREATALMERSLGPVISASSAIPLSQIIASRLFTYADLSLDAFMPGEALKAVRRIESSSNELSQPLDAAQQNRLTYQRAKAMMQFGSWQNALEGFRTVQNRPYLVDARYYEAIVTLGVGEVETAKTMLNDIIESSNDWRRANDALRQLTALEPLVGEPLEQYCTAQLMELQGRFADAEPLYRQIAVALYGDDIEEWARYAIGLGKKREGDMQAAEDEWRRLSLDVDHPVIHAMIRWELWRASAASGSVSAATGLQDLIMDFPNHLASDLARLEFQRRNQTPAP